MERARRMALEIAGESPTPLEVLLAERIATPGDHLEEQQATLVAWDSRKNMGPTTSAFVIQMGKIQENTSRRYLAAIKTLAQVRKLQANTPSIQFNTQVNVS